MDGRKLPRYIVLDLGRVLHELQSFLLSDDRGYEEMIRQAFDYLSDATPDNNLFHNQFVPHLVNTMVRGLPHRATPEENEEAQLAFATLYDGILRELLRLGADKIVAQGAEFPYVLHEIRRNRQVVLRWLAPYEVEVTGYPIPESFSQRNPPIPGPHNHGRFEI